MKKIYLIMLLMLSLMTISVFASCSDTFEANCDLNESLTLTQDYYNISGVQIRDNNIVLDCNGYTIYGDFDPNLFNGSSSNGRLFYPQESSGNHQNFRLQHCIIEDTFYLFDTSPDYGPNNFVLDDVTLNGENLATEFDCGEGEGWVWCETTYWDYPNIFAGNFEQSVITENITIKNSIITEFRFSSSDGNNWNDPTNSNKKNFYIYNNIFNINTATFDQNIINVQTQNGLYLYNNTFNANGYVQSSFFSISDSINVEIYDNNGYDGNSFRIGQQSNKMNYNVLINNNNFEGDGFFSIATTNSVITNNNFTFQGWSELNGVNQTLDNNIFQKIWMPNEWSGEFTNNNIIQEMEFENNGDYNDYMNVSGNYFGQVNNIIGGNTGLQYFYNNIIAEGGQFIDNTDYEAGDYITFCVDGIGNTYLSSYQGGDDNSGTCESLISLTLHSNIVDADYVDIDELIFTWNATLGVDNTDDIFQCVLSAFGGFWVLYDENINLSNNQTYQYNLSLIPPDLILPIELNCQNGETDDIVSGTYNISWSCIEDWSPEYTDCILGNHTLIYTDLNDCGTYDNLPIDNGTISSCTMPITGYVVGTYDSGDITNVTIDFIVKLGMFAITFATIIGLVFVGGWVVNKINLKKP